MDLVYRTLTLASTSVGFLLLGVTTVNQLADDTNFSERIHKLCTRWVTFVAFVSLEPLASEVLSILPLGRALLLVAKLFVILPENRVSTWAYGKISRLGQRVINKESTIGDLVKSIVLFASICLLTVAGWLISAADIQNQAVIQQKLSKYTNLPLPGSLNQSRSHTSIEEEAPRALKTPILSIEANLLDIHSNSSTNVYLNFDPSTRELAVGTSQATRIHRLREIKYISEDLIKLELIIVDGTSLAIQLKDQSQVQGWVKPVIQSLSH